MGEEGGSVSNTSFPKDWVSQLFSSSTKEFPIASGSPTKVILAPEIKQTFKHTTQGSWEKVYRKNLDRKILLEADNIKQYKVL